MENELDGKGDHEQRIHRVIFEQKMRDGECAMTLGLSRLLNIHSYTLDDNGFFDVYVQLPAARHRSRRCLIDSFERSDCKTWHQLMGDFWGGHLETLP
jgi:hypothetical protein